MNQSDRKPSYEELVLENTRLKQQVQHLSNIIATGDNITRKDYLFITTIVNSLPIPVFFKDTQLRYQFCNEYFADQIVGKSVHEILDKDYFELSDAIPREFADKYNEMDRKILSDGRMQIYEGRVKCADDVIRPFLFHKSLVFMPGSDEPLGIIGSMFDLSSLKKTEEELRVSNARLLEISRTTNDAIWFWDILTDELTWGEGLQRIFGYATENIYQNIGWWFEHLHEDDAQAVIDGIYKTVESNNNFWSDEYRFKKADGSYAIVQDKGRITRNASGKAIFMCGGITDVTMLRAMETEIKESEALFRSLFENIPDPVMIASLSDGKVIKANQAACALAGYSMDEIINKSYLSFHKKEELKKYNIDFSNMDLSDPPLPPIELTFVAADGTNYAVEVHGLLFYHHNQQYIIGVFRNLEHRKKSEKALIESEEKYRNLVEQSPDGIIVHQDSRLVFANSAALKIMKIDTYEDIAGKNILEFVAPDTIPLVKERMNRLKEINKYLEPEEETFIRADGKMISCEVTASLIHYENKQATQVVFRDITNKKRIEKELKETNAAKDTFFSILAHDLKNPFQVLIGLSSGLRKNFEHLTSEAQVKYIADIERNARTTYQLIENLLVWARSQSGKITAEPEVFSLEQIIQESMKYVRSEFQRKQINFLQNLTEGIRVYADSDMLQTVLRNLLSNAVKFTNRGGSVTVAAQYDTYSVRISVSDTGVGMAKNIRDNLFKIDKVKSEKGTENERGTGLGLILAKEFIEKNNGTISVESQEQKGTTFLITLPTKPAH